MDEKFEKRVDEAIKIAENPDISPKEALRAALRVLIDRIDELEESSECISTGGEKEIVEEPPPALLQPPFVPQTLEEVDRLLGAIEDSRKWFLRNTRFCPKCRRYVPVTKACQGCAEAKKHVDRPGEV